MIEEDIFPWCVCKTTREPCIARGKVQRSRTSVLGGGGRMGGTVSELATKKTLRRTTYALGNNYSVDTGEVG